MSPCIFFCPPVHRTVDRWTGWTLSTSAERSERGSLRCEVRASRSYGLTWLRNQLQLPPLLSLEKKVLEKKTAATTRKSGS